MKLGRAASWLVFLLGSLLILSGCVQKQVSQSAISPTQSATPTRGLPTLGPAPTTTPGSNCAIVSEEPTPGPTEASLFKPVTEADWIEGDIDAPVTFLVYVDFQCPYCAQLEPVLAELLINYPDDLRVVYRHYPLEGYDKGMLAAQAAEAAGAQNHALFFEMKTRLFTLREEWVNLTEEDFRTWLGTQASEMDLDQEQFTADLENEAIVAKIKETQEEGLEIGIPGTPYMLIDGDIYQGPRDYTSLEMVINLIKLADIQYTECPPYVIDPDKHYQATIVMEQGEIVIELLPDTAELAVNNFVYLARNGWYDNSPFFRVIPGFYAQTGDPSGTGYGGPGFTYVRDNDPLLSFDRAGVVAMSNFGSPNSDGSQFFITYQALPELNGLYTIFGYVIQGMDVLESLEERNPATGGDALPAVRIITIKIEETE